MSSIETMKAWAQVVKSRHEIPEFFREGFDSLPFDLIQFPYTILTPSYEGFMHRTTPKLVCCGSNQIFILEKRRKSVEVTCFEVNAINYVEVGTILLKSWIKICGITQTGLTTLTLDFNAVTLYLFTPLLNMIRLASALPAPTTDIKLEQAKFDYLLNVHFKFMNYARSSIIPGERVICSLLQPEIKVKLVELFHRPFFRTISVAHLNILTDRELIIISEDTERWANNASYGGIWRYIPLKKITALAVAETRDDTLTVAIRLAENEVVRGIFSVSNEPQVSTFLQNFKDFSPGILHQSVGTRLN